MLMYVHDSNIFRSVLDKQAPLSLMSCKKKRLSNKPWITPGIQKSITKIKLLFAPKNKLFKKLLTNNNSDKK